MKRLVPASLSLLHLSLVLCAILCAILGCADESAGGPDLTFDACAPLDIGISPALTAEQMQGVTDALAMWNQAAGTALTPVAMSAGASSTGGAGGSPAAIPADPQGATSSMTSLVPLTFQVAPPPFHGLYDTGSGQIYVNEDLVDVAPLRITVAHEIGHAFGLKHVSGRPSLMNSGNTTIGITPEDVDTLAAIWGRCAPAAASPATPPPSS